jgi:hypothetical protein
MGRAAVRAVDRDEQRLDMGFDVDNWVEKGDAGGGLRLAQGAAKRCCTASANKLDGMGVAQRPKSGASGQIRHRMRLAAWAARGWRRFGGAASGRYSSS